MASLSHSSLKASQELGADFRKTLNVTQPLMEILLQWHNRLPRDRRSEDAASLPDVSNFLHVGYHAVRAILFRAMMRPFRNSAFTNLAEVDLPDYNAAFEQVWAGSRACCTAFLSYIRQMDSKDFHSFWPFCKFDEFRIRETHRLAQTVLTAC